LCTGTEAIYIALFFNAVLKKTYPVTYPACRDNPLSAQKFNAISEEIG
jgi:hypothetical protein